MDNICVEETVEEEKEEVCVSPSLVSRPPDGGWGWIIAFATFVLCCLIHILPYCFGILFSGFLLDNGASSTTTAWIYNLYLVLWFLTMTATNALCEEFGQRLIGYIGVSMASVSIVCSGFSPNVSFLFFSFSVLGGVSTGLVVGISFMVLPPYFDKRTGLANTFLTVGAPITQMLVAPFARYLIEEYSLKGAALICAGMMLNGIVSVSLFHPVKWHLITEKKTKVEEKTSISKLDYDEDEIQPIFKLENCTPVLATRQNSSQAGKENTNPLLTLANSIQEEKDELEVDNLQTIPNKSQEDKETLRIVLNHSSTVTSDNSVTSLTSKPFNSSQENVPREIIKPGCFKMFYETSMRVIERIKSDLRVLKQFRALILCFTILLTQTTFLNFIMMVPFVAEAGGHSLQDSAQCISFLGVTSLILRLIVSPLSDWKRFSIRLSIMTGYVLRATGIIVAMLSTDRLGLMATGVIFGLGLGMSLGLLNPCIVHYMGLQYFKPTIGSLGLLSTGGFIFIGPLIGLIRDTTESYPISLSLLVGIDVFSALLWLLMPRAQARDANRNNTTTTTTTTR